MLLFSNRPTSISYFLFYFFEILIMKCNDFVYWAFINGYPFQFKLCSILATKETITTLYPLCSYHIRGNNKNYKINYSPRNPTKAQNIWTNILTWLAKSWITTRGEHLFILHELCSLWILIPIPNYNRWYRRIGTLLRINHVLRRSGIYTRTICIVK